MHGGCLAVFIASLVGISRLEVKYKLRIIILLLFSKNVGTLCVSMITWPVRDWWGGACDTYSDP